MSLLLKTKKVMLNLKKLAKSKTFDFKPLSHDEIGESLDLIDFETATELKGSWFNFKKRFS